jgi:hypothetical protein
MLPVKGATRNRIPEQTRPRRFLQFSRIPAALIVPFSLRFLMPTLPASFASSGTLHHWLILCKTPEKDNAAARAIPAKLFVQAEGRISLFLVRRNAILNSKPDMQALNSGTIPKIG